MRNVIDSVVFNINYDSLLKDDLINIYHNKMIQLYHCYFFIFIFQKSIKNEWFKHKIDSYFKYTD